MENLDDIEALVSELATRVEDIEIQQLDLEEPIRLLTPTDDLETVKTAVNHIIKALNKAAV